MVRAAWRDQTREDWFWAQVQKTDTCWSRAGMRDRYGYNRMRWNGKQESAHRVSWELHFGPIPAGMHVCHNCPGGINPACVRPDHLFLGTMKERVAETVRQGRHSSRTHPELVRRGEGVVGAKLTEAQVREAFRLQAQGLTPTDIATLLPVSRPHIGEILRRKHWKHVEVPVELVS